MRPALCFQGIAACSNLDSVIAHLSLPICHQPLFKVPAFQCSAHRSSALLSREPDLERFDSAEEQARAALMNGGISDPSTTPSSSDSSQGECCSICQAEQDMCPPALAAASPAESRLNLARTHWQVGALCCRAALLE